MPFDSSAGRRFTVIFVAQIFFLDPGYEFLPADDAPAYYLIADALALNHLLDQGFAVALPGFVRVSAKIGEHEIIRHEVLLFSFTQIAGQTAPGVALEALILFPRVNLLHGLDPNGVEMDVAGEHRNITIFIHQNGFVSSLIKMAGSFMAAVEISDIGDVEVAHEFGQVPERGLDQQVKMVGHQDVAVELDRIDVDGLIEKLQKAAAIRVIPKNILFFVAAAGDVVNSVRVLDAKRSGHAEEYCISRQYCQTSRSDPNTSLETIVRFLGSTIGAVCYCLSTLICPVSPSS